MGDQNPTVTPWVFTLTTNASRDLFPLIFTTQSPRPSEAAAPSLAAAVAASSAAPTPPCAVPPRSRKLPPPAVATAAREVKLKAVAMPSSEAGKFHSGSWKSQLAGLAGKFNPQPQTRQFPPVKTNSHGASTIVSSPCRDCLEEVVALCQTTASPSKARGLASRPSTRQGKSHKCHDYPKKTKLRMYGCAWTQGRPYPTFWWA